MRKRKKKIIIVVSFMLILILLMVSLYFYGLTSVSHKSEKVKFTIESGTSTKEVINKLYEAHLIKSKIATFIYVGLNRNILIKAGEYELDRNYDTKEIFTVLDEGDSSHNTITITFIEGKRIADYISQIKDKFGYSEEDFLAVMNDSEYLKELINKYDFLDEHILNEQLYYPLEGYLFPSTYEFYKDASLKDIIEKMLDKCDKVLDNYNALIKTSGYTTHEILTIASIVESEAKNAKDRPMVSQVIYKRLNMNMSLGMDSTATYGAKRPLNSDTVNSDVNEKNPYNTRDTSFIGLPIGPICSPSEESIKAALSPSETNYVYFISDGELNIHFAETYNEFLKLKEIYG